MSDNTQADHAKESLEDRFKVRAEKRAEDFDERRQEIAKHIMSHHEERMAHKLQRREDRAKKTLNKVVGEIDRIVDKKDVHSYDIAHWLRQLNHASNKLIDVHEEAIDNNFTDTDYIHQKMPDLFGVSTNLVDIGKQLISAAAGKHTLKAGAFDNAGIADKLGGIKDMIQKIISGIPTGV